jgi:hypothetical protein
LIARLAGSGARVTGPEVAALDAAVYVIPTDAPEADERTRDQLSGWVEKRRIPRVKIKTGESWAARSAGTWPVSGSRAR